MFNTKEVIDKILEHDETLPNKVNKSTIIPTGSDLNNYKTEGMYHTQSAGIARGCLNIPYANIFSFSLVVPKSTDSTTYKTQILIESGNYDIWTRKLNNGTWTKWEKFITSKHLGKYNLYYQDYRFIATSFNNNDMKLVMMYSNDGMYWHVPNPTGDFTSTTGNGTLRDPSLTKIGEYFYIVYTKIAWGTGSTVGYCRTRDFVNFEEYPVIKIGSFVKLWAPEFFRDYNTGKLYLVFSGSATANDFRGYIQEIVLSNTGDGSLTLVGNPIKLTGDVGSKNAIDFSILQDANRYYLAYKDETNKYLCIAQSFSLTGDYKDITTGKCVNTEGAQIIKTGNGYRIFLDEFQGETKKLCSIDVSDAFNSFGNLTQLKNSCGFVGSHMFVYDTAEEPPTTGALKPACIVKRTSTANIVSGSVITLNYGEKVRINDMDLNGTANIVIPTDGFYQVQLSLAWDTNGTGYRQIAIEHSSNGGSFNAVAISQVPAVQGEQTAQTVSALIYANAGDKVRTVVKHTAGVALKIVNWTHSAVFSCYKI